MVDEFLLDGSQVALSERAQLTCMLSLMFIFGKGFDKQALDASPGAKLKLISVGYLNTKGASLAAAASLLFRTYGRGVILMKLEDRNSGNAPSDSHKVVASFEGYDKVNEPDAVQLVTSYDPHISLVVGFVDQTTQCLTFLKVPFEPYVPVLEARNFEWISTGKELKATLARIGQACVDWFTINERLNPLTYRGTWAARPLEPGTPVVTIPPVLRIGD